MNRAIIVGAGISGLVSAHILADAGWQITLIEKRNHIGGNTFDYYDDGVLIHRYGPHLFHTNLEHVWKFISQFSDFFCYEHKVLGEVQNKLVPIPFNFQSIDLLFDKEQAEFLKSTLTSHYGEHKSVTIGELRKSNHIKIQVLAEFIFENVFYHYTKKQWGIAPENMDPTVMGRVPVRLSYDDRYFTDRYQMMPVNGFTVLFQKMLQHSNIALRLNCNAMQYLQFCDDKIFMDGEEFEGKVLYTGSLDELFNYEFGRLPYRSLAFVIEKHFCQQYQPTLQINYPNKYKFTRTSEFKLLQKNDSINHTAITYEYPITCGTSDIPYYPITNEQNTKQYIAYKNKAGCYKNLYCLGRLSEYRYCNMDIAIDHAMVITQKLLRTE